MWIKEHKEQENEHGLKQSKKEKVVFNKRRIRLSSTQENRWPLKREDFYTQNPNDWLKGSSVVLSVCYHKKFPLAISFK